MLSLASLELELSAARASAGPEKLAPLPPSPLQVLFLEFRLNADLEHFSPL